jgi:hypothetical protein
MNIDSFTNDMGWREKDKAVRYIIKILALASDIEPDELTNMFVMDEDGDFCDFDSDTLRKLYLFFMSVPAFNEAVERENELIRAKKNGALKKEVEQIEVQLKYYMDLFEQKSKELNESAEH